MKHFKINKVPLGNNYTGINTQALGQATKDLNLTGLRLYLYLASNKDGFKWTLNSTAFGNWAGIDNTRSANKAIKDGIENLTKNGYLILVDEESEEYRFFEQKQEQSVPKNDNLPKKEQIVPKIVKRKEEQIVPDSDIFINKEPNQERVVPKNTDLQKKEQVVPKTSYWNSDFVF